MKGLDENERFLERQFGLISGFYIHSLHEMSTAAGSKWDMNDPSTMEIIVTKNNAEAIYAYCKEIRNGYDVSLSRKQMKLIKEARMEAHKFLYDEANDPDTPITRKIQLVKLTGKNNEP